MTAKDHSAQSRETLDVIHRMEAALGAGSNDMAAHFHEDFLWRGNAGCGIKRGLAEFRANWQLPLRAAFTDRTYLTEKFLADGDWAACFGHIEATHSGPFMGLAPTGARVRIPYMDFWRVEDGRIADNPVFVDFAAVLAQLGRDVFGGEGWEAYDSGAKTPPHPE
ncbi:ester cyclase [Anianabacter salinae]|uniref:ester cyclase n=1 Tax=Anianabacter salinae TaxID=2851023 RepID=UPI00225E554F|nr:ester cyclase [Anianabacter salinae]MBV0914018.1 ester cyclase [Anianabacter salinae]